MVTVKGANATSVLEKVEKAGIPAQRLGRTAGNALILPRERPILIATLVSRFEGWLPGYMAGHAA